MVGHQPYVRGSSAAKLLGVSGRSAPLGRSSICPAGSKIEAASEDTTSKSKRSVIEILIPNTAAEKDRVPSMVNDYSYGSISSARPVDENSQRKRPLLGTAAERWEVSTSRGNDTIGRNHRVLPQMVGPSSARYLPKCQADLRYVHSPSHEIATLDAAAKEARS